MIYVASPYSHTSAAVRHIRRRWAEAFVYERLSVGQAAVSPLVSMAPLHLDGLAMAWRMPPHDGLAAEWRRDLMRHADALALLALSGWETSAGVAAELAWRREFHLPIEIWLPRGSVTTDGFRRVAQGDPTDAVLLEALT